MSYKTGADGFRGPVTGRKMCSIAVSEETHRRISEHARKHNLTMQQVVEAALAEVRP